MPSKWERISVGPMSQWQCQMIRRSRADVCVRPVRSLLDHIAELARPSGLGALVRLQQLWDLLAEGLPRTVRHRADQAPHPH